MFLYFYKNILKCFYIYGSGPLADAQEASKRYRRLI